MPDSPYLAEVYLFAGNFAPRGFAFCQGQILSIAQNTALFSLLGTTYGGNGQTTFALPDLRGRVPVGTGQGPGLPAVNLGEVAGAPSVTLIQSEMPAHSHTIASGTAQVAFPSTSAAGDSDSPNGNVLATSPGGDEQYAAAASANGTTAPVQATLTGGSTSVAGGSQPHNNMQPYLGLNYVIAVQGIFPSRN